MTAKSTTPVKLTEAAAEDVQGGCGTPCEILISSVKDDRAKGPAEKETRDRNRDGAAGDWQR